MPCTTCPGSKASTSRPFNQPAQGGAQARASVLSSLQAQAASSDQDFVMSLYNHPNRGSHRLVGGHIFEQRINGVNMVRRENGYSIDYGYRSGGDKFLVHIEDIKAHAQFFIPMRLIEPVHAITAQATPPPPPQMLESLENEEPPNLSPIEDEAPAKVLKADKDFDMQLIPGVTPLIAQQLKDKGIKTAQDIIDFGNDGLIEIKGIGPSRAALILAGAQKKIDG